VVPSCVEAAIGGRALSGGYQEVYTGGSASGTTLKTEAAYIAEAICSKSGASRWWLRPRLRPLLMPRSFRCV
jgi:hypothetical protein